MSTSLKVFLAPPTSRSVRMGNGALQPEEARSPTRPRQERGPLGAGSGGRSRRAGGCCHPAATPRALGGCVRAGTAGPGRRGPPGRAGRRAARRAVSPTRFEFADRPAAPQPRPQRPPMRRILRSCAAPAGLPCSGLATAPHPPPPTPVRSGPRVELAPEAAGRGAVGRGEERVAAGERAGPLSSLGLHLSLRASVSPRGPDVEQSLSRRGGTVSQRRAAPCWPRLAGGAGQTSGGQVWRGWVQDP